MDSILTHLNVREILSQLCKLYTTGAIGEKKKVLQKKISDS